MDEERDDIRRAYEQMKRRFRTTRVDDFKSGKWFAQFVHWMLKYYAKTVDADYFKRTYPGADAPDVAKKLITVTSRHNAIAGGISAAAYRPLSYRALVRRR